MADRLTQREVLELVRDCSSQEWQQPDGKRMGATDNQGRRMWFITEDVMQAVRDVLGAKVPPALWPEVQAARGVLAPIESHGRDGVTDSGASSEAREAISSSNGTDEHGKDCA